MGTICVSSKTLFGFNRKRLAPRVLSWQQLSRCHFLSSVMYISGAKFDEHCFNISGDILNSVFYRFSGTIFDSLVYRVRKEQRSKKEKNNFKPLHDKRKAPKY